MAHRFKYVTCETGLIILRNHTLRWSTPPLLNDPFDMQAALQLRVNKDVARKLGLKKAWEHLTGDIEDRPLNKLGHLIRHIRLGEHELSREEFEQIVEPGLDQSIDLAISQLAEFSEEVRNHFIDYKIFCLSDVPDSILMWSYYAGNHSGLVLRFTDQTPDNPISEARPVQYVPDIPSLLDDEALSDILGGYVMDHTRVIHDVVWTKSHHWAHEREWRICTGVGRTADPHEDVPFGANEIDGVIFGVRTSNDVKAAVADVIKAGFPHVELMQAILSRNEYALLIEPWRK